MHALKGKNLNEDIWITDLLRNMASPLLSTYMEGQSLVMSESFKYYFCVWLLLNLKRKKKLAQVRCLSY